MKSKYIEIYDDFSDKIKNGKIKSGTQMPSEQEMMDNYGVSRDTVRKAMALLVQDGYIIKSRGKKSLVADPNKISFSMARIISFAEMAQKLGWKDVVTTVEDLSIVEADAEMAEGMECDEGELLYRVIRSRKIDGERIILDKDYFIRHYIPKLTKEICTGSIYKYIEEELGLKIGMARKIVTVQPVTNEDRIYMDVMGYDVVAVVTSHTAFEDGTIFQMTVSRHRIDKFEFEDFAKR